MSVRRPKNVAASIHDRLSVKAEQSGRTKVELLVRYANERFLYRLSRSRHADSFVLKGAMMQLIWTPESPRPTKDIDLLGNVPNEEEHIEAVIAEVCRIGIPSEHAADGIEFDAESMEIENHSDQAEYPGFRVKLKANLGRSRVSLQIDIGIGDVVHPRPQLVTLPTLLDHEAPVLNGYSEESTIAEKLHIMASKGEADSRLKDFYDVWMLSR